MRNLLIELSMECESLAKAEVLSACHALGGSPKVVDSDKGVLVVRTSAGSRALSQRVALCHFVSEWLGSSANSEPEKIASNLDLEGPIRVRATKVGSKPDGVELAELSKRIGGIIARDKGVDLRSPKSDVRVVVSERTHIGKVVAAVDRPSFEKRKNRYLPFKYPASLHPKYARALTNIVRVQKGGRLLDPFCGTGAVVAEAAMIGLEAVGSDISARMLEGAGSNLRHIGVSARLVQCDVGDIAERVGRVHGIATDPPYGRSTSTNGEVVADLYARAFEAFGEVLRKGSRLGIVLPSLGHMGDAKEFILVEAHPLWVHRSLTRHFCVLEKA